MPRAIAPAVFIALLLSACGGSSTPTAPTAPAPIPAAEACNALGSLGSQGSMTSIGILSGAECDVTRSPVVKLNMRTSEATGGFALGSCTGTLVTPRTVLTAAHCLDGDVGVVRVWLGTGPEYVAQSFAFYPGFVFGQSGSFDIGVVVLAEDLPRTPVSILTSRTAQVGETAIIAGFGRNENVDTTALRAGSTKVSNVTAAYIESQFSPPSSSICQGDSGGPIFLSHGGVWTLAGVSSATSGTACNEGTNFYQAVTHQAVLSFILQHVPAIGQR